MRTYTILVSIVAHALGVIVIITSTVLATDSLPEPRRATEFIVVKPELPTLPPPAPRRAEVARHVPMNVAPSEAPDAIRPEPPRDPAVDALAGVNGSLVSGDAFGAPVRDSLPPPPPVEQPPVHVGGVVKQPQRTRYVTPAYPAIAREAHVSGVVILEAVIGEDGAVRDVRVLRSIPLLDQAAIDAVRQWQFTPTLLNGQPVPIVMTVTVAFELR